MAIFHQLTWTRPRMLSESPWSVRVVYLVCFLHSLPSAWLFLLLSRCSGPLVALLGWTPRSFLLGVQKAWLRTPYGLMLHPLQYLGTTVGGSGVSLLNREQPTTADL